ncbi:uncharacterized protein LOC109847698 [Asparagus officinalis]|uniref:uncharacterized protein LOC109847698 n=1 Tax=Asparagus officinalis TaxID=4686 RepID=UPI00098E8271|nr:uncharacterized protein LOC109847698 [Asparagus officinalis]
MTGIKKYALLDTSRPPMTNWASGEERIASMRMPTIISKAKSASITFVHRPIAEVASPGHVHSLPAEQRDEVLQQKRQAKRKALQEETTKNFSIGYIMAKHIDVAFDDEEEINVLPIEQQLTFWRNSAKFLKRLLVATKQTKSKYCKEFMIEINRLNRIIEKCGRHDEVIDPVLLKSNIKHKIANEIRKKRRPSQEEQKSKSSSVYKEEPTMQEHVHKIVEEDVMQPANDEAIEEEPVTSSGEGVYNNKGFDEDPVYGVDKEEDIIDKEKENVDKLEEQEEKIKHDVDKLVEVLATNVEAKSRPQPRRVSRRSKWKRTPYTEGKRKKKEKNSIDILESPESKVKLAEKVTHFYPGNQIPTFDALSLKPMIDEEEDLLGELNNELPDPTLFNLRIIDSTGAFVHNLKITSPVAERLDKAQIESLTKFYSQKIHSINREELLYVLRGGRLDDKVEEAVLDTISQEAYGKGYGVVSVFFLHSLYGLEVNNYEHYLNFIDKYTAYRIEHLLIPLVRDDHWHLVEVDLKDKVVKHYSSAGHEAWMEPVNKIIKFFDAHHADFIEDNVRQIFRYQAIKCEQQRGRFDCGVFVYLFVKSIIEGRSTLLVNPPNDIPEAMRARLATQLLLAGFEQRHKEETLYSDE